MTKEPAPRAVTTPQERTALLPLLDRLGQQLSS